MKDEIKEIYLSNLEWTKTHDNIGDVMGNIVFKDNMPYETYQKLLKSGYFVLCDKNYITNLQEENERLKVKLENKLTPNELVSMLNQELVRQNKNYKSRNEKAIEYLEDRIENSEGCIYIEIPEENYILEQEEILNILKGEDKDVKDKR